MLFDYSTVYNSSVIVYVQWRLNIISNIIQHENTKADNVLISI